MSYPKNTQIYYMNTADDLSGEADHSEVFYVRNRCKLHAVRAYVTTVLDGAATIQFDITSGGERGEADGGSIVIPTTTAATYIIEDRLATPVILDAGDFVTPQVSSGATSGACLYSFELEILQDNAGNETYVTASA